MQTLLDMFGDGQTLLLAGVCVGVLFGVTAQRSAFCLRASCVELVEGRIGPRMSIWLIAFSAALAATQGAQWAGWLDVSGARQISGIGSLSGAIIGGLMFGIGMILARGCASRLLVLSATGNLRALITGLVLTLVAQASLNGLLAPLRETLAQAWTVSGPNRDAALFLGVSSREVTIVALLMLAASVAIGLHRRLAITKILAGAGVGLAVAAAWSVTYAISITSFEIVPISGITFTGPATDTLMALVAERSAPLSFGLGLVPGVFLGAGITALIFGDWKLERFGVETPMERYLIGAVLMGFGAMLAGGCAVGSAMSGGAILSLTAWVAALSIWVGGAATAVILTHTTWPGGQVAR